MSTASTISIPRCTGRCAAEDRELVPGEPIVVVLTESIEDESLIRTDISMAAWERQSEAHDPARIASWRSTAPHPDTKPEALISAEGLLDMFEQLADTEDPGRLAFRYVLALQLMRKRKLEYAGSGDGVILVRPRGADPEAEPIAVHDPQAAGELDEEALTALAEQVETLMDGGDDA